MFHNEQKQTKMCFSTGFSTKYAYLSTQKTEKIDAKSLIGVFLQISTEKKKKTNTKNCLSVLKGKKNKIYRNLKTNNLRSYP